MPIYEFQCNSCGHIFEKIVGRHDRNTEDLAECPHCNTQTGRYLPSAHGGYSIRGDNSASVRPRNASRLVKREK